MKQPSSGALVALGLLVCSALTCAAPASIAFVAPDEEPRYTNLLRGLRQGLAAAGAGAEQTHIVEYRVRRDDAAKAMSTAQAMLAGNTRVAFVVGTELTKSIRSVATELPVVFITPGDPVRAGLASSLGRPGNHLTGMTFEFPDLSAKRLQLLKELVPAAARVGVVFDRRDASPRQGLAAAQEAASRLGLQLVELDLATFGQGGDPVTPVGKLDGLLLIPGGGIATATGAALKLAAAQRIVSVAWARSEALQPVVLSYGVDDVEVARSAARLVVRVLDGRNAGDLPIEQPTRFELVINLWTAKALGLTIPPALLMRADRVIE
jgi:putative tryptophan/tyrosine transport system substrate-binding protein